MSYNFGGRLRAKDDKLSPMQMLELRHARNTFVYKRLSSHEQVKKSVYSLALQDALEDIAREDGYKAALSRAQLDKLRQDPDYAGHYTNGQIIVEERDLGISGTLGRDHREGLGHLISRIEHDDIESIYVVHISRLFRDQTLIDGLSFGELCKEHDVILVMPNMRLNLRDKMHMRIYRMELERAAEELELMKLRLGSTRELKAKHGYYAAGCMALGYIINRENKESKDYDRPQIYEPHARIVRRIFSLLEELNYSPILVARRLAEEGVFIPPYPPKLQYMEKRSSTLRLPLIPGQGYRITRNMVRNIGTNPIYIGWWIWAGEVVSKNNHPPIIAEEVFWRVQERFATRKARGRAVYPEPYALEDLLYCVSDKHSEPVRIGPDKNDGRYRCNGVVELNRAEARCFSTSRRTFEDPIEEFIVSQCSYPQYADRIIKQLRESYDDAKAQAEARRKEVVRLTHEIDKLKENLAYTKTEKQAKMILDMIEQRMTELEKKSAIEAYPAGRVGQAIHIDQARLVKVKQLLSNLPSIWNRQPPSRLKNEFFRIILEQIQVRTEGQCFRVWIHWRMGLRQEILIHKPDYNTTRDKRWTDEEARILKQKYPTAEWREVFESLPRKSISAVLSKAGELRLVRKRKKGRDEERTRCDWTADEDKLLLEMLNGKMRLSDLVGRLRRYPSGIDHRMKQLGLVSSQDQRLAVHWQVVDRGSPEEEGTAPADKNQGNDGTKNGGGWRPALVKQASTKKRSPNLDVSIGFQTPNSRSWACRTPRSKNRASACAPRSRTRTLSTRSNA